MFALPTFEPLDTLEPDEPLEPHATATSSGTALTKIDTANFVLSPI